MGYFLVSKRHLVPLSWSVITATAFRASHLGNGHNKRIVTLTLRVYIFCFWAWLTLFLYSTSNTQRVKRPNELYSICRFSQRLNNKSSFRLAKSLHLWLRFILYADRHKNKNSLCKSLYAKIFHITKCFLESNKIVLKKTRLSRWPFQ